MNFDPAQMGQLLSSLQFPINKDKILQMAQQYGANDQIMGMLQHLPNQTFNSLDDIKKSMGGLKNLGGISL